MKYVIACDLGTGGCKSSLYDENGNCLEGMFREYKTFYPSENRHEQRPEDWFDAVTGSISSLLEHAGDEVRKRVAGLGLSGHSLAMVPLNENGGLLMDQVPIWSDSRPGAEELDSFFEAVPEEEWYSLTGNGFPAPLYTVFKILWLRNHDPECFKQIHSIPGSKDYINYRLTGRMATDFSYASGSGVYDLLKWDYSDKLLKAADLKRSLFPEILPSSGVIGTLLPQMADRLGLSESVRVVAGGVDNACMALGARCFKPGRIYNSLGSSSWIAISSDKPVIDADKKPFVFTHVVPGQFTSATSIFAAGSSHKWFSHLLHDNPDYAAIDQSAGDIEPGSEGLIFNPSLAGGSTIEKSPRIRGAFLGLSLHHTRAHLSRAVLEGIGYGLRGALDVLRNLVDSEDEILVVGGGSRSRVWMKILSDVFGMRVIKSSIDQQAAALGAAALTLVGCGLWEDFSKIDDLHETEAVYVPDEKNRETYRRYMKYYLRASDFLCELGDLME